MDCERPDSSSQVLTLDTSRHIYEREGAQPHHGFF